MKNIVLIGMPAAGKSTVGVLLAKTLGFSFVDTDLIIQQKTGWLLQDIIDRLGLGAFYIEEEHDICSVEHKRNAVIATGGSAVYSQEAMKFLKKYGIVYYLSLPTEEISRRLSDITTRGIAKRPEETIEDVFENRAELYQKHADVTIDCLGKTAEQTVAEIAAHHKQVGGEDQ